MSSDNYLYDVGGEPSMPPFRFTDVGMRVFPLRANFGRLKEFCNQLLNGFPEVAEFRPIDGFVELIVLEYSSITSVEQPAFATYGQTEVFFMVPVMWKERATGKQHFAVITPYIFVDNPVSARLGRDLFGWPKEAAWYRRDEIASGPGPGGATQMLSIDTEMLSASGTSNSRLLEIDDQPDREWLAFGRKKSADDVPLDLGSLYRFLARPWLMAGRGFDLWRRGLLDLATQPTRPLDMLNINLKQFPQMDPESTAAYQALTVTPLRTTRLNGFGLIGERKQLMGDPSGGCLVRIYEDPTWPVVAKLGLTYDDASPQSSEPGARLVYRFRPVLPVWCNADFDQHPCRILSSRGTPARGASGGTTGTRVPLNTTLGSRTLLGACSGTTLSGVRVQLFGLSAEARAHQKILDELNRVDMGYVFELPDKTGKSSVVVSVATFEGMRADRLSLPGWHGTLVELFVPVLYRRGNEAPQVALFSHAGFTNSNALSNAMHDVLGANVIASKIRRGDTANQAQGVDNRLHVFRVSTSVVRQFQLGERACVMPVIDVFGVPRASDAPVREPVVPVVLLAAQGAAMDLPTVPILRLKQVPSAEDLRKTSYQALVKSEWRGARGKLEDVGIDHELRLFEYDSMNLVNRLGLHHNEPDVADHLAEQTDEFKDQWQVYRRPFAETLLVLDNDVTIHSEVLWERRQR